MGRVGRAPRVREASFQALYRPPCLHIQTVSRPSCWRTCARKILDQWRVAARYTSSSAGHQQAFDAQECALPIDKNDEVVPAPRPLLEDQLRVRELISQKLTLMRSATENRMQQWPNPASGETTVGDLSNETLNYSSIEQAIATSAQTNESTPSSEQVDQRVMASAQAIFVLLENLRDAIDSLRRYADKFSAKVSAYRKDADRRGDV